MCRNFNLKNRMKVAPIALAIARLVAYADLYNFIFIMYVDTNQICIEQK